MESSADLEETADAAAQPHLPFGRLSDPAEDLEQRTLASAIAADNAEDLALLNFKSSRP